MANQDTTLIRLCDELVCNLHRNTDNIMQECKQTDFFRTALVLYVKLYCKIVIEPVFPAQVHEAEKKGA